MESPSNNEKKILSKNLFSFLYVIGKGGFGKVWKVQSKSTKSIYALKEMSKLKIIDKKSEKSINSEREFLSKLHHPFIVNMHYAFQDHDNLYLIMDFLNGGDLRYHISRYRRFSEEQTRFFIACMIYSLEYIHSKNIIHRDIKPENLVLDENGYLCITDFGIAKENMPDNSSETSGTPGYMSPEVMREKNHSFPVDFFAIGVIGFEFMMGKRPYYGKNRREIKEQMLSKQVKIKTEEIKSGWSPESADFINNLLMRKPDERLGTKKGASELKEHSWLKYYPWNELQEKKLPAPFIPEKKDNFDKHYCESIDKIGETTKMRYEEILFKETFKNAFVDFYFNKEEEEKKKIEEEKKKIEEEKKRKLEEEKKKKIEEEKKKKIEEEKKQNENKKKNITINSPMNLINKENIILNIPNSHNIKSNNDLLNSTNIKNINNNNNNNHKNRPSSSNKYRKINNNKNNILNMKNKINNKNNNNIFQENLLKHSNSQKHVIDIKKIEKNSKNNNNNNNINQNNFSNNTNLNFFIKLNNNIFYHNNNNNNNSKNNSTINLFNKRLIYNYSNHQNNYSLIKNLIKNEHIRSLSVLEKKFSSKNFFKNSSNNNSINNSLSKIKYNYLNRNKSSKSKNKTNNNNIKKINRINSASIFLNKSDIRNNNNINNFSFINANKNNISNIIQKK